MKSFFEITGHIVELDHTSLPSPYFGEIAAERPERGRSSAKAEEVTTRADRTRTPARSHWDRSRKMRIRTALTVASTVAFADGPLPVGDTIAVAGLLIYAGWELGHEFGILD